HTILVLLRPEAAHANTDGKVSYSSRPGRGRMLFEYEVVRLWERPAERLLEGDVGLAPLAVLGRLPEGASVEDAMAVVAQRLADRLQAETQPERAAKLLTTALLLAGLRVRRNVALNIFRGVHMLEESDTYLMILEQGAERTRRGDILLLGEARLGSPDETVRDKLTDVTDLERLKRMLLATATATNWQEILDTP
ncbi:MAG TPA: hypothetical protein VF278_13280, partial [Pirellulales bacterium]